MSERFGVVDRGLSGLGLEIVREPLISLCCSDREVDYWINYLISDLEQARKELKRELAQRKRRPLGLRTTDD